MDLFSSQPSLAAIDCVVVARMIKKLLFFLGKTQIKRISVDKNVAGNPGSTGCPCGYIPAAHSTQTNTGTVSVSILQVTQNAMRKPVVIHFFVAFWFLEQMHSIVTV